MNLKLVREQYKPNSTIGRLLVDGTFECFTLEDGVRTSKVFGETAIPPGTYRVTVEDSPRFKRKLPRLHDVANFSGVLIHPGNTAADTHGCVLVGQAWQPGSETIGASRAAFAALFDKITGALARGDSVSIEVVQTNAPAELLMRSARPTGGVRPASPAGAPAKPRVTKAKVKTKAKKAKARPTSKAAIKSRAAAPARAKPKSASRRAAAPRHRAKR
ncbi:MAG: hypothetical protein JNK67_28390 [Alphaproteobacteria bacterium]|nr:hypothetical protein [Alphaproteobacteria bacterium]